jgi:hypothetical protein
MRQLHEMTAIVLGLGFFSIVIDSEAVIPGLMNRDMEASDTLRSSREKYSLNVYWGKKEWKRGGMERGKMRRVLQSAFKTGNIGPNIHFSQSPKCNIWDYEKYSICRNCDLNL